MKKAKSAVLATCIATMVIASACSGMKLVYPVDSPDPREAKSPAKKQGDAASEKAPQPEKAPQKEEKKKLTSAQNAVVGEMNSDTPAANPLALTVMAVDKKATQVETDAVKSERWQNGLEKEFPAATDQAWDRVLGLMIGGPLIVVDRASGVIISDWIVYNNPEADAAGLGLFGDGQRITRYKYAVKVAAKGDGSEVTVISYTQYTSGKRWVDAKPQGFIGQQLMKKIIDRMEEK